MFPSSAAQRPRQIGASSTPDALALRGGVDRLHRGGRNRRGDRNDRSLGERGQQAILAVDDGVDLIRIADAQNDEVARAGDRGRRICSCGAGFARLANCA